MLHSVLLSAAVVFAAGVCSISVATAGRHQKMSANGGSSRLPRKAAGFSGSAEWLMPEAQRQCL